MSKQDSKPKRTAQPAQEKLRGKVLVLPLERHARRRENTGVSRIGVRSSPAANRAKVSNARAREDTRAQLVHFICKLYRDLEGDECRISKESE